MNVTPKKRLGQHFLTDLNIANKIVDSLLPVKSDKLIEVGSGKGVLTEIIEKGKKWDALYIEIDDESVVYLKEILNIAADKIIDKDFLKLNLSEIQTDSFSVIGNFPYNISSQIFFKVLENRNRCDQVVCMIQKEVAQRIAAPPGNKTYGILSVLLQAYYKVEYLFTVHQHVFHPPPKVKSAVIRLTRNSQQKLECDEHLFFKIVKQAFNQRRKTLRNSLKPFMNEEIKGQEIFNKRPEQLSVHEFVYITNLVSD